MTDVVGTPTGRAEAPAVPVVLGAPVAEPLQGRALIGRLEQLAQAELGQLAERNGMADSALPAPVDAALAGLAWDLGLSGEAAVKAARDR